MRARATLRASCAAGRGNLADTSDLREDVINRLAADARWLRAYDTSDEITAKIKNDRRTLLFGGKSSTPRRKSQSPLITRYPGSSIVW